MVGVATLAYTWLNRSDQSAGSAALLAGAPASVDLLARGEYLAKAADCVACHSVAESHRPFAGGVAFKLPMGTVYSSNITADLQTGIGSWSDDQFVRAVREGVRKDGAHLYPAFPYTSYTQLSRSDVLAIKAYLFSLPAIKQMNRENAMEFPFNQRWALGFWNAAFFKSARFVADASKSPAWNSGAYIATALGHCAECHTPRNLGFGLQHRQEFAGQELQGWRAYNITSDPRYGIGAWTDGELAQYLKTGHAPGHASASGPMGEAVEHSLQYLDVVDVRALVAYLRSMPAHEGKQPIEVGAKAALALASTAATPASGEDPAQGLRLFAGACSNCHQWDGSGQPTPYASLLGTRSVNDVGGANVTQAILQGVKMRIAGSDLYMPSFAGAYSNTEVAALANFVVGHFGGKPGTVTPNEIAERRKL